MSEPEQTVSDKLKKKQPKEGFIKLNLSWTNNSS